MTTARILVVDDNPTDITMLLESLEGREIEVQISHDPVAGLAMVTDGGAVIDLVVLDHSMPGMTGLEWLARLRAYPRFTELPVVVWTGSTSPAQSEELRRLNAAVQRKPANYQEVLAFSSYLALKLAKTRVGGASPVTGPRR